MRGTRHVIVTICIVASGCAVAPRSGAQSASGVAIPTRFGEMRFAVAELTNRERTRARLPALRVNSQLMEAAQLHAEQIARARTLAHDLPHAPLPRLRDRVEHVRYSWGRIAENIASGHRTASDTMAGWMDSPGHRTNILNRAFMDVGTGFARDEHGRRYYVQVFGAPPRR